MCRRWRNRFKQVNWLYDFHYSCNHIWLDLISKQIPFISAPSLWIVFRYLMHRGEIIQYKEIQIGSSLCISQWWVKVSIFKFSESFGFLHFNFVLKLISDLILNFCRFCYRVPAMPTSACDVNALPFEFWYLGESQTILLSVHIAWTGKFQINKSTKRG